VLARLLGFAGSQHVGDLSEDAARAASLLLGDLTFYKVEDGVEWRWHGGVLLLVRDVGVS
jgi:hypothetical protein